MKPYLSILFLISSIGLSGCAFIPYVEGNVESFNQMPADWRGKSIQIAPYKGQNPNDLQWRSYKKKLENKLQLAGLRVVSGKSDYVGFFGFAIDQGRQVTSNYAIPQFGVTGYSGASSNTFGNINTFGNTATYSGTTSTSLIPTYGVTGYAQGLRTDTMFTRSISLEIKDVTSGSQLMKTTLVSPGTCGVISEVIDELLELAVTNFPKVPTGRRTIIGNFNC